MTLTEARAEQRRNKMFKVAAFARLTAAGQATYDDSIRQKLAQTIGELEEIAHDIGAQREAWWASIDADDDDLNTYHLHVAYENQVEAMVQPLYEMLDVLNDMRQSLLELEDEDVDEYVAL